MGPYLLFCLLKVYGGQTSGFVPDSTAFEPAIFHPASFSQTCFDIHIL